MYRNEIKKLSEETKIFEGMLIQSNQNIYQCHLIE